MQYVMLVKPLTAFCKETSKMVSVNPADYRSEPSGSITKETRATGLLSPHPEFLKKIVLYAYEGTRENRFTLFLSDDQIKECLVFLITPQMGQIFKAIQDTHGNDNCYNSPSRVAIPKGSLLLASAKQGTNRGDYFMGLYPKDTPLETIQSKQCETVVNVFRGDTFHPYDVKHLDPRYFVLLQ